MLLHLVSGCTTRMQDRHHALYLKRQSGELTEAEYQQRLEEIRDEQPWGGVDSDVRWENKPMMLYPVP